MSATTAATDQGTLDWPGTLVETGWLATHLDDPRVRVLDIRGAVGTVTLPDGTRKSEYTAAHGDYAAAHIPGAAFVDWIVDIVDPDDPIPAQIAPPARFAALMGRLGIGDDTAVVIYDQQRRAFGTRLWWVLTYYGHARVAILNGGWEKWQQEGRPTSTATPAFAPATFTPKAGRLGRKTGQEVLEHVEMGDALIVDALRHGQYTGDEPRGGAASGHIPGALNLPYTDLFSDAGTWKSDEELRESIAAAGLIEGAERPIVAYCGGGVAATAVLFALDRLGVHGHNYDGSWNEWGNDARFPVRQGEQP